MGRVHRHWRRGRLSRVLYRPGRSGNRLTPDPELFRKVYHRRLSGKLRRRKGPGTLSLVHGIDLRAEHCLPECTLRHLPQRCPGVNTIKVVNLFNVLFIIFELILIHTFCFTNAELIQTKKNIEK